MLLANCPVRERLWFVCLLALAFLVKAAGAAGADARFSFQNWQTEDGLPANNILAITQTPDGYLWLGTPAGLVRFDGLQFATFSVANSPGLLSDRIYALAVDRSGALWAGTGQGVARLASGKFTTYANAGGLANSTVSSLVVDGESSVWAGGPAGLDRIREGVITHFPAEEGVRDVGIDRSGRVWAMFNGGGLHLFENGRFERRDLGRRGERPVYQSFFEDSQGNVWTAILYHGVVRANAGGVTLFSTGQEIPQSDVVPQGIVEDSAGNIWFSFPPVGLARFLEGKFHLVGPADGLPTIQVRALFVDREDNLWVATSDTGLVRLRSKVVTNLSERQGLDLYSARAICNDGQGGFWIANENRGLFRLRDGRFSEVSGTRGGSLWSLAPTKDGQVYGGEYPHGVDKFPGVPRLGQELPLREAGHVQALLEDSRGALWIGTEKCVYRYKDAELVSFTGGKGVTGGSFASLAEDSEGAIWVGAEGGGLHRIKGGRITRFGEADGLRSESVRCLHRDDDGAIWAGTARGLSRYDGRRFQTLGISDGLEDEGINQVLDDGLGNLWLGCSTGIFRVQKRQIEACFAGASESVHPLRFGKEEGMASLECRKGSQPSCVRGPDGKLYFLTLRSIAVIDPAKISTNQVPPTVVIQSVQVDGAEVLGAFDSDAAGLLVIPPGAVRVEYHFAGLSLTAPRDVRYHYRLEGFDKGWQEGGGHRFASYTRVPPGSYRFHVRAGNRDGVWNEQGATLALVMQPLFWQTLWFKSACVLTLLVSAAGLYKRRVAQLEQRRADQAAFSRELISSQEQERKRIAGDLHDSLSQELQLIRNRAQMMLNFMNPAPPLAEQISAISSASSKAIADTRAISYALRPPELEHFGLTRAVESMLEKVGEASGLQVCSEIEPIDGLLEPEMEINLFRILQEALNNVIKHAHASRVIVTFRTLENRIEISVFDNGRGFAPESGPEEGGRRRGSLGLGGMKERAAILGGTVELQSAPGKGTRLDLILPLGNRSDGGPQISFLSHPFL